jgi:hypothetical protein
MSARRPNRRPLKEARMDKRFAPNALALCALLALAACGGRPDEGPAAPAAQAQGTAEASGPSSLQASTAAAIGPADNAGSAPAAGEDTVARLSREVAQLHREVSDLRQQMARGGPAAPTQAAVAAPDARSDPEARAEAARTERLRIASSEQSFRNQQVDARWSQGATASVRSALADVDEGLRNQVRSVECRGQTCRVEIASDNGGAAMRDLPLLVNRLGASLPNVTAGQVDQGDGRQATVLYLSAK